MEFLWLISKITDIRYPLNRAEFIKRFSTAVSIWREISRKTPYIFWFIGRLYFLSSISIAKNQWWHHRIYNNVELECTHYTPDPCSLPCSTHKWVKYPFMSTLGVLNTSECTQREIHTIKYPFMSTLGVPITSECTQYTPFKSWIPWKTFLSTSIACTQYTHWM